MGQRKPAPELYCLDISSISFSMTPNILSSIILNSVIFEYTFPLSRVILSTDISTKYPFKQE